MIPRRGQGFTWRRKRYDDRAGLSRISFGGEGLTQTIPLIVAAVLLELVSLYVTPSRVTRVRKGLRMVSYFGLRFVSSTARVVSAALAGVIATIAVSG